MPLTKYHDILKILVEHNVEFVVIGGVAAVLHGSAYITYDIDLCYNRSPENLTRVVKALSGVHPKLRNAPPDLPFLFDEHTLKNGLNFTFATDLGNLDLLGEVGGLGFYKDVVKLSKEENVLGLTYMVLNLDGLIKSKKFAGRKKDEPVVLELEAIKEMLKKKG